MGPQEQERIYFVGGTGGVGAKAVQDVLAHNIPITIYTRQPEKSSFKDHPKVTHVQGDYDDLTPFEKSIGGHTRMFLLVRNLGIMPRIKGTMAKAAYAAGVKQIVDVSSLTVSVCPSTFIGQAHARSEDAIRAIQPVDASYVSLRPWRFMSNHAAFAKHLVQTKTLASVAESDTPQGWISTNDIGALAAIILRDPIEKHGDAIYPMIGELLSANQRAEILNKVLGFKISVKQWSFKEQYELATVAFHAPHKMAYDMAQDIYPDFAHSPGLSLVLGREPETLEQYLSENKDSLI